MKNLETELNSKISSNTKKVAFLPKNIKLRKQYEKSENLQQLKKYHIQGKKCKY